MSLRELLIRGAKAYESGDLETLTGDYADDVVLVCPDGRFEGIDAARDWWRQSLGQFSDTSVEVGRSLESGDEYFGDFHFRGTNTGALPMPDGTELAATGRTIEFDAVEYVSYANDRVVEHRMIWDNAAILGQLGLLPG